MLKDGRVLVRCSTKLARAFGLSYRELWQQLKSGQSGFVVHEIPTRSARRTLKFLDLRDVNSALGYSFHDPPSLGPSAGARAEPHDGEEHQDDVDIDADDEEDDDEHVH